MPSFDLNRTLGQSLATLSVVAVALFAPASASGQVASGQVGASKLAATPVAPPAVPTLASMEAAGRLQDYTSEQLRYFRAENGSIVVVRERLEVDAGGSHAPQFALTFLGVLGEAPGSAVNVEWQQTYARYGSSFFQHGSFRVFDLAKASGNYSLHDFGPVVRANRSARRMVVFPNTGDKAIWVVDVDMQTSVPLFIAEFDNQLRMLAEIEVLNFAPTVQAIAPVTRSSAVLSMASFGVADTYLGSPSGLIDPNLAAATDYSLRRVEVEDDPLNGRQKLVMTYTDGIDQFVVVQTPGSLDPFAGLPSSNNGGHTIARFRDPALSALIFWDDGVMFNVAGRGALHRLDDVARGLYLQALSTN